MSIDARITPIVPPRFGCHSELDKYRNGEPPECTIETRQTEKACEGCARREIGKGE